MNRNLETFREEFGKTHNKRPTSDKVESAPHNVGYDFGRSGFKHFLDGFYEIINGKRDGFTYIGIGNHNFARKSRDKVASFYHSLKRGALREYRANGNFEIFRGLFSDK